VDLKIPEGTTTGRKLRLRNRGIPGSPAGNLYATVAITLPPADSDAAKQLYRKMEHDLAYDPRSKLGV
jgi:curved DNA-binding protein